MPESIHRTASREAEVILGDETPSVPRSDGIAKGAGPVRLILLFALISNLAAIAVLPGCGGSEASYSGPMIPVKGIVRFRGAPLVRGTITFEPEDIGREAHGEIQNDGTFVITTFKDGDGVVPGTFRVAINGQYKGGKATPVKYRNASSSKLLADVSSEKTEFAFDLK